MGNDPGKPPWSPWKERLRRLLPGFTDQTPEDTAPKPFPIVHPYRWYGWWREDRTGVERDPNVFPSIHDVIDPGYRDPDQRAILNYLQRSRQLTITGGEGYCVLNCRSSDKQGGVMVTDGVWLWFRPLVHYVEQHHVRLPPEMVEHVRQNQFVPQLVEEIDTYELSLMLDWPYPNPIELARRRRLMAEADG